MKVYLVALFALLVMGTSAISWAQDSTKPSASASAQSSKSSSSDAQMPSDSSKQMPSASASASASTSSSSSQSAQTAEGELSRVDSQKQQFWVKTADGKEMQFSFTSATPVSDAAGKAEGLTSLGGSGTQVKVTYDTKDGVNTATKIEIQSRKS
jgi:hypothetical protein